MNTWPTGYRCAISQDAHEKWNAFNYPGTRQLCIKCEEPTGRCEEDALDIEDEDGNVEPYCESCYEQEKAALKEK